MTEMLERGSSVPLYRQLEDILYAKIVAGEWAPNERIPSENELDKQFGLSRMTVRGVLNKLASDGLLIRVPGKGTYVAPSKISAVSPAYRGVREQLESLGYATKTRLLSHELVAPSPAVRDRLGLAGDDRVYAIVRLRSVDGEPISLHRSYVPARLAPSLDDHDVVDEQLCVVLEQHYGLPMKRVDEELEALIPEPRDAELLRIGRSEPVLRLSDVIRDGGGRPFEFSMITFRADKMRLRFDYQL
jgi:GntR family transcriptional regulator